VFARAKEKAKQASCTSNLKQGALAVHQYITDWDERFCRSAGYVEPALVLPPGGPDYWWMCVSPYMKNDQILVCPTDSTHRIVSGGVSDYNYDVDYSWNTFLNQDPIGDIKYPAANCMLADGSNNYMRLYCPADFVADPSLTNYVWAMTRHNDGYNCAFVDGHAKWNKTQFTATTPGTIDFHMHEVFHP